MNDESSGGWRVRFPLALSAAALCAHLATRYRRLARRLDVQAREHAALREVARELGGSVSVREVMETIATRAVASTRVSGAYVERVETPAPGTEVEVVASAGTGVPPVGMRIPYPGSLTAEIIESGLPEIVAELGAIGERMARYLRESCSGCSGLVVPLLSEGRPLGALVFLRGADRTPFSAEEAEHARALGGLASAALRRALLVEEVARSEGRFRQIADHLPEVIWLGDPDFKERYYVNPAYEEVWGRSRESFYAHPRSPLDAVHPEDRARVEAAVTGVRRGEYDIEYRIIRPDGELRWIRSRGYPVRNESGEVYRIAGIMEDVTERKRVADERERLLARERAAREEVTTLLESITDAFFAVDREWRFTYVNREAERVLRKSREELLGKSMWQEFPEAVEALFHTAYHRAVAEQRPVEFEEYYPPLDIWVNVRGFPTREGLSVYFRDVTDRKRAEEELRESERNFRALSNSIPQLAWMAAPDGAVTWYNRRWYDYTGMADEEALGWGWRRAQHPDHVERVTQRLESAFERGEAWEDTFPLRSRTGAYRWFLSRAVPIKDAEGRVLRWFGTHTDVTERLEAEAERERLLRREQAARAEAERQREELERVTESRTHLVRGFSHDLKNPLAAADGYAALLEDGVLGELSARQRDSVRRIRRSIHTSLRLIHDLLELARAEAGQLEVECLRTDIAETVREVAEDARAQVEAAALALEVRAELPLPTETDPARVRQILANLLSNAVKYTDQGRIEVVAEYGGDGQGPAAGEWIAVRVTDTGPGIPEEQRERIFQEFFRLEGEAEHGAGIGLAISRRISRLLGGEITVESEVGRGSTFTLWLPRDPAC